MQATEFSDDGMAMEKSSMLLAWISKWRFSLTVINPKHAEASPQSFLHYGQ